VSGARLASSEPETPRPTSSSGPDTGVRVAGERTALVLEDDEAMGIAIADALADRGWDATVVDTLGAARATIRDAHPTLLVLDLTLKDEFGATLLDELAGRDDAPATVIVSGFGLAPLVAARYEVELVNKPFSVDAFIDAVERARGEGKRPRATD
jgi:DNA-binding NtrC family response regulator